MSNFVNSLGGSRTHGLVVLYDAACDLQLREQHETRGFLVIPELLHVLATNHGKVFKSFILAYRLDWGAR
jgi:hypothetical protein